MTFEDILPDTTRNNRMIQRALRRIDTELLCTALIGCSESVMNAFFRNTSTRVQDMCRGIIAERESRTGQPSVDAARAHLLHLLDQVAGEVPDAEDDAAADKAPSPDIDLSTAEALVSTFRNLALHARSNGPLSLADVEHAVESEPLLAKGIRLLVDGWEPLLMRSLLEKQKTALMNELDRRSEIILDGIDALGRGDAPEAVEEMLRAHIAGS